ncbi:hypothetical protein D1610_10410 [Sphingomonas gilva]|uniref:DUF4136 domain-containing protein n=1 Tax=Sphingomonas gilva TaxID=2305907 RepID=A0A396RM10_9SPHN|nr:hypothetical protein [Sphingomonas gilva]RHW17378.1 hypothetical protein D1610_10410 [Sphingomonas gilva]
MKLLTIAAAFAAFASIPATAPAQDAVAPGTITVEPLPEEAASPETRRLFAEAVERALVDREFLALPGDNRGRYVARMTVSRRAEGEVAVDAAEAPADGDVGNWGASLRVAMPSGKRQMRPLVVTELGIEILRRDGMQPVWRGRALTVQPQGTPGDAPAALAKKLAGAAMRVFPEQMEGAVSAP